jgi:hypothetical protein
MRLQPILVFLIMLVLTAAGTDKGPVQLTLPLILAILAACYEAISRLIPTTSTWSIIGKVLEVLTWLSNLFDRKK